VENSPALLTRGLGRVLGDLAALGYDCRWTVLGAADVGAPHQRDRFWLVARDANRSNERALGRVQETGNDTCGICGGVPSARDVAHAHSLRELQPQGRKCNERGRPSDCGLSNACSAHVERQRHESERIGAQFSDIGDAGWWQSEPNVGRVANGVAARVDRLKAIGNGQVPLCAATAWRLLTEENDNET
jgi:DNA (cytosine-5)-methyltransferase 1